MDCAKNNHFCNVRLSLCEHRRLVLPSCSRGWAHCQRYTSYPHWTVRTADCAIIIQKEKRNIRRVAGVTGWKELANGGIACVLDSRLPKSNSRRGATLLVFVLKMEIMGARGPVWKRPNKDILRPTSFCCCYNIEEEIHEKVWLGWSSIVLMSLNVKS